MRRALTMLCRQGDVTIYWDEAYDEKIIPIIEKKMKEGVSFFIIEPRPEGVGPPRKYLLENIEDARNQRALQIRDADFADFVRSADTSAVGATPSSEVKSVRRAKTAKEVASNQTVGVEMPRGG